MFQCSSYGGAACPVSERRAAVGRLISRHTTPNPARNKRYSSRHVAVACAEVAQHRLSEWVLHAARPGASQVEIEVTGDEGMQGLVDKLTAAAESCSSSSPSTSAPSSSSSGPTSPTLAPSSLSALLTQLPASPSSLSTSLSPSQASALLFALGRLGAQVPQPWLEAVLEGPLSAPTALGACTTRQLAEAAWAVSELSETSGPGTAVLAWANDLLASSVPRLSDFFAPDLASLLCACGALFREVLLQPAQQQDQSPSSSPSTSPSALSTPTSVPSTSAAGSSSTPSWQSAVAEEACYQLSEFMADFRALDVAQLASGLADLKIPVDGKLKEALMKAAYSKTNTIEEKAAVDFALSKLEPGSRSMHFDPRWTHEEMSSAGWLPRSERDKQRIIKENWSRTQWGGF